MNESVNLKSEDIVR